MFYVREILPGLASARTFLFKIILYTELRAGIFKQSMGARNRGGIGLSYRPPELHRLAEFIPWNRFQDSINVLKYGLCFDLRGWELKGQ
jgi:hypothetical protein